MMLLMDEFERARVELVFVNLPRDDTPEGRMMLQMRGMFAEYERTKIQDRTRRGRERRSREGKVLCSQATPYGYTLASGGGRFEIVESEAPYVRLMFEWLVYEHCTLNEIARRLMEMGAPTKRGAACWRRTTVRSILTNSVYTGRWYWNKTEAIKPKERRSQAVPHREKCAHRARPREEWIAVNVLGEDQAPIISPELFEAVSKQLQRNKEFAFHNPAAQYLLRGMIFCPDCNRRLVAHARRKHKDGGRYGCTGRRDPILKVGCRTPQLTGHLIEQRTWEKIVASSQTRRR